MRRFGVVTPVLQGVRVLDLTHAFAGPFSTYQLALLGADVVKVERPQGDDFRARPEVFSAINAGKRSITLDLTRDDDRASLLVLAEQADVLVHNFRPDVPAKLGIDWETLEQLNPRLIYAAISGYGDGPDAGRAAIEWAVQASSGLMQEFVAGAADDPTTWYPGISVVDPIAGYTAFAAILAALLERERTGTGQRLDIAMMDSVLSLMGQYVTNAVLEGPPTYTLGARLHTSDGLLYVAMSHQRWFEAICQALGAEEAATDPRFIDDAGRTHHYAELVEALEEHTRTQTGAHWEAELGRVGVPSSVLRSWAETARDPGVVSRGLFRHVETPWGRGLANAGGFQMASLPSFSQRNWRVPAAGEHTASIVGTAWSVETS